MKNNASFYAVGDAEESGVAGRRMAFAGDVEATADPARDLLVRLYADDVFYGKHF